MFGRFVPDFGRVVAQMQFDMYHHYTVDEHSIRAIGLLSRIERGELADDHPLSTALFKQIASRRVLYVAVLLHDIAKGRGGDHSELGAEVALELCPRFGLDEAETETVAWLVRYHLLLSNTAFRRDIADPKTVEDFVRIGAEPGAAAAAADPDRGRYPRGRSDHLERLEAATAANLVRCRRGAPPAWPQAARPAGAGRRAAASPGRRAAVEESRPSAHMPAACPTAIGWPSRPNGSWPTLSRSRRPKPISATPSRRSPPSPIRMSGMTRVTVFAPDRPGLFYRIAAAPERGRRLDRRRPDPHYPRRHGARQSAGHRRAREGL